MELSPRCPVCKTAVAADRIAEIQANLSNVVNSQVDAIKKNLLEDADRRAQVAVRDVQEKARVQASALTDQNSKLKQELSAAESRRFELENTWAQREKATRQEFEKQLATDKAAATRAGREEGEVRAAAAEERLAAVADRLSKSEAQVSTLRAESSRTIERLNQEFVQRLKTATAKAATDATAELTRQLNSEQGRAAALEAKVAEVASAAKVEAASKTTEVERIHAQELLDVRHAYQANNEKELQKQETRHRTELERYKQQMADMQRQIEKQTADELGRWPEVDLCQTLREAFKDDHIRQVDRGERGADIVHEVVYKGEVCGKIVYDSKNSNRWLNEYVDKLRKDRDIENADNAILSTNKFPSDERQRDMCIRNEVLIARPHTVLPLATVVREAIIRVHRQGLTASERASKMAELYNLIISEPFRNRMSSARNLSEQLDGIDTDEKKQHDTVWKKRGIVVAALRRTLREIDADVASVVEHAGAQSQIA